MEISDAYHTECSMHELARYLKDPNLLSVHTYIIITVHEIAIVDPCCKMCDLAKYVYIHIYNRMQVQLTYVHDIMTNP